MCGIAGMYHLGGLPIPNLRRRLALMNEIQRHRGPDGCDVWVREDQAAGLAHRRLAIVDLSVNGAQPMRGHNGDVLVHNGEVYNFVELRRELEAHWSFHSDTDTEVILAAHERYGLEAIRRFRGMFAYALHSARDRSLTVVRDPFGIKPVYYAIVDDVLIFGSEIKTILPFLHDISTDDEAFAEYIAFQIPISERTLFKNVFSLPPGSLLRLENGGLKISRHWELRGGRRDGISAQAAAEELDSLLNDSLSLHLRSDVPVGAYLSGGMDSSLIAIMAAKHSAENRSFFHGKFADLPGYDESLYARDAARTAKGTLHEIDITAQDFLDHIGDVIYHLDHPVAGPGSLPQYMTSMLGARHVKVVLGGQGGDEIFGGYSRYFIGLLENLLGDAINGAKPSAGSLSLAELIPALGMLKEYVPLIRSAWSEGLFGPTEDRYLRLINRSLDMDGEIDLAALPMAAVEDRFRSGFRAGRCGTDDDAFDLMMRFDFHYLLPALLQVEDRMGMAHGLESRVPFLDRPLVEFLFDLPTRTRIEGGQPKALLRKAFGHLLPDSILKRRDKMGFPVPLKEWFAGPLREPITDLFRSEKARKRPHVRAEAVLANLSGAGSFSRSAWAMISLELWRQRFEDQGGQWARRGRDLA